MFKIVPTDDTEKFLEFLRKEAPRRIKELEHVVATQIDATATAILGFLRVECLVIGW